ncbi:MAG TPA: glycosyltransferase family 1 protein, partial [Elainellaceae cyanobacterium]
MKTVALIDVNHGRGHHLTYMRFFCKTLLELGYRVMAFYPDPDAITNWLQSGCSQHLNNFYVFEISEYEHRKVPLIKKIPSSLQPVIVLARWQYTA